MKKKSIIISGVVIVSLLTLVVGFNMNKKSIEKQENQIVENKQEIYTKEETTKESTTETTTEQTSTQVTTKQEPKKEDVIVQQIQETPTKPALPEDKILLDVEKGSPREWIDPNKKVTETTTETTTQVKQEPKKNVQITKETPKNVTKETPKETTKLEKPAKKEEPKNTNNNSDENKEVSLDDLLREAGWSEDDIKNSGGGISIRADYKLSGEQIGH